MSGDARWQMSDTLPINRQLALSSLSQLRVRDPAWVNRVQLGAPPHLPLHVIFCFQKWMNTLTGLSSVASLFYYIHWLASRYMETGKCIIVGCSYGSNLYGVVDKKSLGTRDIQKGYMKETPVSIEILLCTSATHLILLWGNIYSCLRIENATDKKELSCMKSM